MRVQELRTVWTDEGILEMTQMRVQKMNRKKHFFIKHIVDIDALFELHLAIICSVCINTYYFTTSSYAKKDKSPGNEGAQS